MKKTILFIVLCFCFSSLFASPTYYIKPSYMWSYDTNVFSEPLPRNASIDKNGNSSWLEAKVENPFIKRFNHGFSFEGDIFFKPDSRTGLSFSLNGGIAYDATTYTPQKGENGWSDFTYKEADALSEQEFKLFFGIGPTFRAELGFVDLGLALRASIGSYDLFSSGSSSIVFGLQAEPYLNVFFSDNFFFFLGLHYDAHLMKFLFNDPKKYYEDNYVMLTAGAFAGIGFTFGDRSSWNI